MPRFFFFYGVSFRSPAGFAARGTIAVTSADAAEAATTAAESSAAAAESATTAALFAGLGLRLVDADGASVEFMSVQRVNRCLRLSGVGHGDEAESLAATGHAIGDNANGGNFAKRRKRRFESLVSRRVCEVTNIDFHLFCFLVFLNALIREAPASQVLHLKFINFSPAASMEFLHPYFKYGAMSVCRDIIWVDDRGEGVSAG
jgi:hypothetical protein